jgi:hypothetical protein
MYCVSLLFVFSIGSVVCAEQEDETEKRIKVWEDRIQHTDLDADEVNFPLFLHEQEKLNDADEVVDTIISYNDQEDFNFEEDTKDRNSSIITFFHKITRNNVTKEGVTKIPSTSVLPLIKTALGSISEEHVSILLLGAILPLMMMVLPFAVMSAIIPIFLVVGLLMFGAVTSSFFFMPLALFGFGVYAATDISGFEIDLDEIGNLGEKVEEAIEKVEDIPDSEHEVPFQITNNNNVPRLFF